jgi:Leucine-rich repeat (LRR) protein
LCGCYKCYRIWAVANCQTIFSAKLQTSHNGANKFRDIPKAILLMPNLKSLVLDNNKIAYIPEDIAQMKQLKEISLRYNPISEKEIEKLKTLLPDLIVNR